MNTPPTWILGLFLSGCGLVGAAPDFDGDGYVSGDCAELDSHRYPGAVELVNDLDDDCDGEVDNGTEVYDDDGDGYSEVEGDCHDGDAEISPGGSESVEVDSIDNNCDGRIDEGTEVYDDDGDGYSEVEGDCDDTDSSVSPSSEERCDGIDQDCDGEVDEGYDGDGDGYLSAASCLVLNVELDLDDHNAVVHPGAEEICDGLDNNQDGTIDDGFDTDGDGYTTCGTQIVQPDCDDSDSEVFPSAAEDCNGIDDNCDHFVDEGYDLDEDGFSSCGLTGVEADRNDHDDSIFPGAPELCDGKDNDQDNHTDEDFDLDGDGWLSAEECSAVYDSKQLDCNDFEADVNPNTTEVCNNQDDNCDGDVDEGVKKTFFRDSDGDGFGDEGETTLACYVPDGFADNSDDCDDEESDVSPDEEEVCFDAIDQDCDGRRDGGCGMYLHAEDYLLSPSAGTVTVDVKYPEDAVTVVAFLAVSAAIENGDDQCDWQTIITEGNATGDDGWASASFDLTLEHCGTNGGDYRYAFTAKAVVVATLDEGNGTLSFVDLDTTENLPAPNSDSTHYESGDAYETIAICTMSSADGNGDVDMSWKCSAAIAGETLSGDVSQSYGGGSGIGSFAASRIVGLGLGSNLTATAESFECHNSTATISHTHISAYGSDHLALVFPHEYSTGTDNDTSWASSCGTTSGSTSCSIECWGGAGVKGRVIFFDGTFGPR